MTWGLVVAAAGLFALIYFVEHPMREARQRQASRQMLPELDPAAVSSLVVHPANQLEIRAECRSNSWRLTKPIIYNANNQKIQDFLIYLSNLQWVDRILAEDLQGHTNALVEYGFIVPQFSVEIGDSHGSRTLRVGTNSAMGDKVFLQVGGSEIIYAASIEVLKKMPASKDDWRDTEVMPLADLNFDGIKVRSGAKTVELNRDAEGFWRLHSPLQARADSPKILHLLEKLQSLQAAGFVAEETAVDLSGYGLHTSALTPALELSFLSKTNPVFVLQMGASPTNHPELVYVRRQKPANIITVPKEPLLLWQAAYTNFLDHHLISCPADQIDSIEVHGQDQFTLRRVDGSWQVYPGGAAPFPADAGLMRFLVDTFTNTQTEVEQTVVAAFENYGLSQPAVVYTLRGISTVGQTNLLAQIELGTNKEGRAFERRTDETSVNNISGDLFRYLPKASWQLRDRRVWNFESNDVMKITVRQAGSTRKMMRDLNGEWTFVPGSKGQISPDTLEYTLHRLGRLTAYFWDDVGDANLEQYGFRETDYSIELEVKRLSGTEKLKLDFGKRSPYLQPYAMVMLDGRRWIFEFPAELYEGGVQLDLTIPPALREAHRDLNR